MRTIAVMIGSDSDLPQCKEGFEYLARIVESGETEITAVITSSIHRNTHAVLRCLEDLRYEDVTALIVGAGCANHLTGTCDAFLRHTLRDRRIVVIGVAFEDKQDQYNTQAAVLSIVKVPGNQVVFDNFVGAEGFLRACQFAVKGELPEIRLKSVEPVVRRTIQEALEAIA